jgi:hypothetical protein
LLGCVSNAHEYHFGYFLGASSSGTGTVTAGENKIPKTKVSFNLFFSIDFVNILSKTQDTFFLILFRNACVEHWAKVLGNKGIL